MAVTLRALAPSDSLGALTALLHRAYAWLDYAETNHAQWDGKRYRSLILVKPLEGAAPSTADTEHRCALARALCEYPEGWSALRHG